jgi:hypothetical protein
VTDGPRPADFIVVACPLRVCRIILPTLLTALRENIRAYGTDGVDSEVAAWIRAVQLQVERNTGADASETDAVAGESAQSNHHVQLTTNDLAAELGCTANNVRDLVRRGRLTPVRRQPMLFAMAEIDRFKAERKPA